MKSLCETDVEETKDRMKAIPSVTQSCIAFEPSYAQAQWHFAREEFISQKLFGQEPEVKGASTLR